jgi:hypothetical protein
MKLFSFIYCLICISIAFVNLVNSQLIDEIPSDVTNYIQNTFNYTLTVENLPEFVDAVTEDITLSKRPDYPEDQRAGILRLCGQFNSYTTFTTLLSKRIADQIKRVVDRCNLEYPKPSSVSPSITSTVISILTSHSVTSSISSTSNPIQTPMTPTPTPIDNKPKYSSAVINLVKMIIPMIPILVEENQMRLLKLFMDISSNNQINIPIEIRNVTLAVLKALNESAGNPGVKQLCKKAIDMINA